MGFEEISAKIAWDDLGSEVILANKTPTVICKKPMSIRANTKIYELLPLPTHVFGTLANTWNDIVGDESMKIGIKRYLEWVRGDMIVVPPLRLTGYTVRLGGGRKVPGFRGRIGYSSISPGSHERYITVFLARLSKYTGTGSGRRRGFGVTIYKEGGVGNGCEDGCDS